MGIQQPHFLRSLAVTAFLFESLLAVQPGNLRAAEDESWKTAREFWAFQAPKPSALPSVRDSAWPRQRIDHFVLARLEKEQLTPAPPADRTTIIRRLTLDLIGLPATPDEVVAFVTDRSVSAYDDLVERLLASPAFGERIASLWLNLARYAEDQAHQVGDDATQFYPNAHFYRRWVIEAFNRDLPYDQFVRFQLAADKNPSAAKEDLAALGFLGLGPKYYNRGRLDVMADEWEDRVDTVTRSFLGLTVACARCHDHKYDPIEMEDYYALAGVFASTKMVNKTIDGKAEPPVDRKEKKKAAKLDPNLVHVVEEGESKDINIFTRGNVEAKGPLAHRRFLRILSPGEPEPFHEGSGRRELSEAIADRGNPLTARVMVNRTWGLIFGRPLVTTPSNFGRLGDRPSHPDLLDDLAVRFMNERWSVKNLVRELVLSSTYRQSSRVDPAVAGRDQENKWLSHMNRRRLTVEQWRDSVLAVAGILDGAGGPSLELDDITNAHRTVYGRISRLKLNDLLMLFDYPDPNVHHANRSTTTTAPQKLFVLNSPFILRAAKALAERVQAYASEESSRIDFGYRLLYGRVPNETEQKLASHFLHKAEDAEMTRWERYCQVLLAGNELLYVD